MKYSNPQKEKQSKKIRRHVRVRSKISGTHEIPRLSVFRSLHGVTAQLIDDQKGMTMVTASFKDLDAKQSAADVTAQDGTVYTKKVAQAYQVGNLLGKRAQEKGIVAAVFDKGSYKYHGRVRALAEGARAAGLAF